jgi:uncharacterized protein YbjQ (UPF0145 family)
LPGELARIVTTTNSIEGRRILSYHGVVTGQTIMGANILREFFASIRDVVGGRSGSEKKGLRDARDAVLVELESEARARGTNTIIGVDLDDGALGSGGQMLMVSRSGTACLSPDAPHARVTGCVCTLQLTVTPHRYCVGS